LSSGNIPSTPVPLAIIVEATELLVGIDLPLMFCKFISSATDVKPNDFFLYPSTPRTLSCLSKASNLDFSISFEISPLRTAASICFLRSADLSKLPEIACMILFCKLPDLIDPLRSPPSSCIILLASINES